MFPRLYWSSGRRCLKPIDLEFALVAIDVLSMLPAAPIGHTGPHAPDEVGTVRDAWKLDRTGRRVTCAAWTTATVSTTMAVA